MKGRYFFSFFIFSNFFSFFIPLASASDTVVSNNVALMIISRKAKAITLLRPHLLFQENRKDKKDIFGVIARNTV